MQELTPKRVNDSAIHDYAYRIFPNDLNSNGTVFGGLVMATLDRVCSVVADRHSGRLCVTASVDSMHFLGPGMKGDILIFMASVNRAWNTSMEIGGKVVAQNPHTGEKKHIVSAYFTFVALDEHQKPTAVPPVIPETPREKERYSEAGIRRKQRQMDAEQRRLRRQ